MAVAPPHELRTAATPAADPARMRGGRPSRPSGDHRRRAPEAGRTAAVRRLPVPVTSIWDWQPRAACRDMDSTAFFPPDAERGPAKESRERRAKRVCAGCPVIEACRRHALAVREPYGVWGGLTVAERAAILRRPIRLHLV